MSLYLLTPPDAEPVTADEAAIALRFDDPDDLMAGEIAAAIAASRMEAEHYLGRSLAPQTWRYTIAHFINDLRLPMGPVNAITSIVYLDKQGATQTLPTDYYELHSDGDQLLLAVDYDWPATLSRDDAVRITYTTGDWNGGVPAAIKRAIIQLAQSRIDSQQDQPSYLTESAKNLLRPYRLGTGLRAA